MKIVCSLMLLALPLAAQVHPDPDEKSYFQKDNWHYDPEKEAANIPVGYIAKGFGSWSIEFVLPQPQVHWNGSQDLMTDLVDGWLRGNAKMWDIINTKHWWGGLSKEDQELYGFDKIEDVLPEVDFRLPKSLRIEDKYDLYGKAWRRLDKDFATELDKALWWNKQHNETFKDSFVAMVRNGEISNKMQAKYNAIKTEQENKRLAQQRAYDAWVADTPRRQHEEYLQWINSIGQ